MDDFRTVLCAATIDFTKPLSTASLKLCLWHHGLRLCQCTAKTLFRFLQVLLLMDNRNCMPGYRLNEKLHCKLQFWFIFSHVNLYVSRLQQSSLYSDLRVIHVGFGRISLALNCCYLPCHSMSVSVATIFRYKLTTQLMCAVKSSINRYNPAHSLWGTVLPIRSHGKDCTEWKCPKVSFLARTWLQSMINWGTSPTSQLAHSGEKAGVCLYGAWKQLQRPFASRICLCKRCE